MALRMNVERLTGLMADFYLLTGIRTVIYDRGLEKVCEFPEKDSAFCSGVWVDPVLSRLCSACDADACRRCQADGALHIYTCHAGLTEAVCPLQFGGVTFGFIMLGQLINSDTSSAAQIGRYAPALRAETASLPAKTGAEIRAAAKLMEACACYLWANELIRGDDGDAAFRLTRYIDEHLDEALSIEGLCGALALSRRKLYALSESLYGMPPAAYIRARRMAQAAGLLRAGTSVADAAAAVGIGDYNYFSKMYRKANGHCPSAERRAAGQCPKNNAEEIRD